MASDGNSAKGIQDSLVNNTANLIKIYRQSVAAGKYDKAGFALGVALHYLADTYTPAHTVRDENERIKLFQDYKLQSPKLHGDEDSPKTDSPIFKKAVEKSKMLIEVANNPLLKDDALRKHLRENFYTITENTRAEGTLKDYRIRLR
jgi:DNA-directed RNA polymerase subunit H (RpoH/RPB5)